MMRWGLGAGAGGRGSARWAVRALGWPRVGLAAAALTRPSSEHPFASPGSDPLPYIQAGREADTRLRSCPPVTPHLQHLVQRLHVGLEPGARDHALVRAGGQEQEGGSPHVRAALRRRGRRPPPSRQRSLAPCQARRRWSACCEPTGRCAPAGRAPPHHPKPRAPTRLGRRSAHSLHRSAPPRRCPACNLAEASPSLIPPSTTPRSAGPRRPHTHSVRILEERRVMMLYPVDMRMLAATMQ